jgi:hypothetical protein
LESVPPHYLPILTNELIERLGGLLHRMLDIYRLLRLNMPSNQRLTWNTVYIAMVQENWPPTVVERFKEQMSKFCKDQTHQNASNTALAMSSPSVTHDSELDEAFSSPDDDDDDDDDDLNDYDDE